MSRPPALLRQIEAMNIAGRERHWRHVPEALARRAHPVLSRIDDALATRMSGTDSLRVNRVIGLGSRGTASPAGVDALIAFFRAGGVKRFAVELAPGPQAGAIAGWLADRGFVRRGGYSLLVRDLARPIPRPPGRVRVSRARRAQLPAVLGIFDATFRTPAPQREWLRAAAEAGEREYYLARIGRVAVGAGALAIGGDLAWLIGGATLTRWRRRGAHAALIVARLRRARRAGCRRAWTETTAPRPGGPQGSRRNMLRLGFEELGIKASFVWRAR